KDPFSRIDSFKEPAIQLVELVERTTAPHRAEREERQLRLSYNLQRVDFAQLIGRPEGEVQFFVQILAECPQTMHFDGQPDTETAKVTREFGRIQTKVHEVGIFLHLRQVLRVARVGFPQRVPLTDEEASGSVWEKEGLVRIECDRIGALDSSHRFAPALGEHEESAICGINVQPEPMVAGNISQSLKVVHRSRIGRACAPYDQERAVSCFAVLLDLPDERAGPDAKLPVGGDNPAIALWKARKACRFENRIVRLVGNIESSVQEVFRQAVTARRNYGAEIRK